MKKLLCLLLLFCSFEAFALEKTGFRLGPAKVFPLLSYSRLYKKEESEENHYNRFGARMDFIEGKNKLVLNQTLSGTYTPELSETFDYHTKFGLFYDFANRWGFSGTFIHQELSNLIDEMWLQENRTKTASAEFGVTYNTHSSFSASAKYIFSRLNTEINNQLIRNTEHEGITILNYQRSKKIRNNFSFTFLEAKYENSGNINRINSFTESILVGPLLRTMIGPGYTHIASENGRVEKTPFLGLLKNFGSKTTLNIKIGQTFTDQDENIPRYDLELTYHKSAKIFLEASYTYGYIRDPALEVFKNYRVGLSATRLDKDGLDIEVSAYSTPVSSISSTIPERKIFVHASTKYAFAKSFALGADYRWGNDAHLVQVSLLGYM